jgi:membrane associated rhomboid family serine protease
MLLYWALLQALGGMPTIAGVAQQGGVAYLAHLGGFVVGAVLIKLFARPELLAAHRARTTVQVHTRRYPPGVR